MRRPEADRPGRGDRVPRRGLLDVRGDDADVAELGRRAREGRDAGAVDAVVVRDEDAHAERLTNCA
jgi:hypothetical protein